MLIRILYAPLSDDGSEENDAAFQYAQRAHQILRERQGDGKNTKGANAIATGASGAEGVTSAVNRLTAATLLGDPSSAGCPLKRDAAPGANSSVVELIIILISCDADGTVQRPVRKLLRSLGSSSSTVATPPSSRLRYYAVALLGRAKCETSAKQTSDDVFRTGRKFDRVLETFPGENMKRWAKRLETQVELEGPDCEDGFDGWVANLVSDEKFEAMFRNAPQSIHARADNGLSCSADDATDHRSSPASDAPALDQQQRLRVVSLLSATTEIVYALGCGSYLVGRSHGCEYPPACLSLPILSAPKIDPSAPSDVIDVHVRSYLAGGGGDEGTVYHVLSKELCELNPDVVIIQNQCRICAVTKSDLERALWRHRDTVKIVSVQPVTLDDIYKDIIQVADALGVKQRGERLCQRMRSRMEVVRSITRQACDGDSDNRPVRVAHLEWLAPLMGSGHWIPQLADTASCVLLHGTKGGSTPVISVDQLTDADVILLAPCGFSIPRTASELKMIGLLDRSDWKSLPAVQNGRVYVADGNSFFNRSSPRVVESAEIFAEVAHEEKGLLGVFGHHGVNVVKLGEGLYSYCTWAKKKSNHDKGAEGSKAHQQYIASTARNGVAERASGTRLPHPTSQLAFPSPKDSNIVNGGPCAVVEAQLSCMRGDCERNGNFAGCRAAYLFNTIANRKRMGSADAFTSIVRSSAFNCFLDPDGRSQVERTDEVVDHGEDCEEASVHSAVASVRVTCCRPGKADVVFLFDTRREEVMDEECTVGDEGNGPKETYQLRYRWATDGVRVSECGRSGGYCK